MNFPTIKLNIFKKLEYFLTLKKIDQQFGEQLKILKNRKWKNDVQKYEGAYSPWEIEKKILFWTYAYHKHLGSKITYEHFKGMFISDGEVKFIGHERIFRNIEQRGFGKVIDGKNNLGLLINKEGLAFGELLWYLCKLQKCELSSNYPPQKYCDIYQAQHELKYNLWGKIVLNLQLFAFYLFMILAVLFFSLEVINRVGLLDDLKNYLLGIKYISNKVFLMVILVAPFIIFLVGFLSDIIYRLFVLRNKYKDIEDLKKF